MAYIQLSCVIVKTKYVFYINITENDEKKFLARDV